MVKVNSLQLRGFDVTVHRFLEALQVAVDVYKIVIRGNDCQSSVIGHRLKRLFV